MSKSLTLEVSPGSLISSVPFRMSTRRYSFQSSVRGRYGPRAGCASSVLSFRLTLRCAHPPFLFRLLSWLSCANPSVFRIGASHGAPLYCTLHCVQSHIAYRRVECSDRACIMLSCTCIVLGVFGFAITPCYNISSEDRMDPGPSGSSRNTNT